MPEVNNTLKELIIHQLEKTTDTDLLDLALKLLMQG